MEAGPLVRSSYHAKEQAREVKAGPAGKIREIQEADLLAPAEVVGNKKLVQIESRNAPMELS